MKTIILLFTALLASGVGCGGLDQTRLVDGIARPARLLSAAGTLRGGPYSLRVELGHPIAVEPLTTQQD